MQYRNNKDTKIYKNLKKGHNSEAVGRASQNNMYIYTTWGHV